MLSSKMCVKSYKNKSYPSIICSGFQSRQIIVKIRSNGAILHGAFKRPYYVSNCVQPQTTVNKIFKEIICINLRYDRIISKTKTSDTIRVELPRNFQNQPTNYRLSHQWFIFNATFFQFLTNS